MSATNPAHQFSQLPKAEVGAYALELAHLSQLGIPLPSSYCIPVSTFKKIAQHNQLLVKVRPLVRKLQAELEPRLKEKTLNQVRSLIKNQTVPHQVTKKLWQFYDQKLDKDFVRLTASPSQGFVTQYKREDNIQGQANLVESLLKLWSRNITLIQLKQLNYFPVAIVVQKQAQPIASGVCYTRDTKTGDKTQITIQSVWGVFKLNYHQNRCDQFIVDQRNWIINQQQLTQKKYLFSRALDHLEKKLLPSNQQKKNSLSPKKIIELAKLVQKIKLSKLEHLRIHWELLNNRLLITKIKPYYFDQATAKFKQEQKYQTILVGQPVNAGFISGKVQLIKNQTDLKNFTPGNIALVRQLNHDLIKLIHTSSAIICQNNITSQSALTQIRQYHLPTIIQVRNAFKTLKNGQQITLNANAGQIYLVKKQNQAATPVKSNLGKPNLLLAINDPNQLDDQILKESQGVGLIRSEALFAQTGQHPLQIIHTKPDQLSKPFIKNITSLYHRCMSLTSQLPTIIYRSQNLTTAQLAKLKFGQNFETTEPNPYLGFRGGLRIIHQPTIFKFELEVLKKINQKIDQPVALMLPLIRTSFELQQILVLIDQQFQDDVYKPQVWLQLSTPENIYNFEQYLKLPLAGVSIHTKALHALSHGLDPDSPDTFNFYSMDSIMMRQHLSALVKANQDSEQPVKLNLNLHEFNQELLTTAHEYQLNAVTVRPELANSVRKYLLQLKSTN